MIDLHLHLLHDTDDGARDLEQAVTMAKIAAADGCTALVATPHQRRDEWETGDAVRLRARLAEIEARCAGRPRLHLGGEVRVDSEILVDLEDRARSGVQSLAGSRYVLLELEPGGLGPDPVELARELRRRGFFPVYAHPEMIPFLWDAEESWFPRLAEAGALLQITAMSVTGDFGRGPKERAWELLRAGYVQFVASDAHRPDWRPPGLAQARAAIASAMGDGVATALTESHPHCVIEDLPLAARFTPASALGAS